MKLRRLLKQRPSIEVMKAEASRLETFQDAGERVIDEGTNKSKKTTLDRLPLHASLPSAKASRPDRNQQRPTCRPISPNPEPASSRAFTFAKTSAWCWATDVIPSNVVGKVQTFIYKRSNGRDAILWKWSEARSMTPRKRDLLTETKFTRWASTPSACRSAPVLTRRYATATNGSDVRLRIPTASLQRFA